MIDKHFRSPHEKMKQPILKYIEEHPWSSATQIAHGLRMKPSSVSSCLLVMTRERVVERKRGCGPRKGFGYRLFTYGGEKTWHERLDTTLVERNTT
jgi:DNA-binding transcriptional regulator GbsR (MarR family)